MLQITGPHEVVNIDPNDHKTAITKLRLLGYDVHVSHKRWGDEAAHGHSMLPTASAHELKALGVVPVPKGGATYVTISRDNEVVTYGIARCSDQDNFDRALGTRIALGRALKSMTP